CSEALDMAWSPQSLIVRLPCPAATSYSAIFAAVEPSWLTKGSSGTGTSTKKPELLSELQVACSPAEISIPHSFRIIGTPNNAASSASAWSYEVRKSYA